MALELFPSSRLEQPAVSRYRLHRFLGGWSASDKLIALYTDITTSFTHTFGLLAWWQAQGLPDKDLWNEKLISQFPPWSSFTDLVIGSGRNWNQPVSQISRTRPSNIRGKIMLTLSICCQCGTSVITVHMLDLALDEDDWSSSCSDRLLPRYTLHRLAPGPVWRHLNYWTNLLLPTFWLTVTSGKLSSKWRDIV